MVQMQGPGLNVHIIFFVLFFMFSATKLKTKKEKLTSPEMMMMMIVAPCFLLRGHTSKNSVPLQPSTCHKRIDEGFQCFQWGGVQSCPRLPCVASDWPRVEERKRKGLVSLVALLKLSCSSFKLSLLSFCARDLNLHPSSHTPPSF